MPKLNKKMEDALNSQTNAEFYSSYLYLSMAAYFDDAKLKGFAHWMKAQAQEEASHATKIYDYVVERGNRVALKAIEAPPTEWDSPLAVFQAVYQHEVKVTGMINALVDLASQENDEGTKAFLQWFVDEQEEEEESADEVVQKLRAVGDSTERLMALDRELAERKS